MRVVDEPLPADGRARLLEVHAHDDAELADESVGKRLEAPGVFTGGLGVVDGAWAHDHHEPVVAAVEDTTDLLTPARDRQRAPLGEGQLLEQDGRRDERAKALDAEV